MAVGHEALDTAEKVRYIIGANKHDLYNVRTGEVLMPDWIYDDDGSKVFNGMMTATVAPADLRKWHDELMDGRFGEDIYDAGTYAREYVPAPGTGCPDGMGLIEWFDADDIGAVVDDEDWVVDIPSVVMGAIA